MRVQALQIATWLIDPRCAGKTLVVVMPTTVTMTALRNYITDNFSLKLNKCTKDILVSDFNSTVRFILPTSMICGLKINSIIIDDSVQLTEEQYLNLKSRIRTK